MGLLQGVLMYLYMCENGGTVFSLCVLHILMEKGRGQYMRVQVAISRWSSWERGGGGGHVKTLAGVDKVKGS